MERPLGDSREGDTAGTGKERTILEARWNGTPLVQSWVPSSSSEREDALTRLRAHAARTNELKGPDVTVPQQRPCKKTPFLAFIPGLAAISFLLFSAGYSVYTYITRPIAPKVLSLKDKGLTDPSRLDDIPLEKRLALSSVDLPPGTAESVVVEREPDEVSSSGMRVPAPPASLSEEKEEEPRYVDPLEEVVVDDSVPRVPATDRKGIHIERNEL